MEISWIHFTFLVSGALFFHFYTPVSNAQLAPAENRILFQVQQFLEFPPVLQNWNNWTSFCYLPHNPFLVIVCSNNHITELTIVGNKSSSSQIPKLSPGNFAVSQQTLSAKFSIDVFFTVLTKLSNLQKLSLVSLGLWGPLSNKINRFRSLSVLNISSNFIYGSITPSIATLQNLRCLVLSNNLLNGSVPDLKGLKVLEELDLSNNHLGPEFPSLANSLISIALGNNSLRSEIPQDFNAFNKLQILDLSSCKLIGQIPSFLFSLPSIMFINLAKNKFSGALSTNISCNRNLSLIDISYNLLIGNLPSCLGSNAEKKTVISTWNCLSNTMTKYQRPYTFCHDEALAVQAPARNRKSSTLKPGIFLGIIGGIIAILGVFGFLLLAFFRKLQRNRANNFNCDSFVIEKTSPMRFTSLGLPPYHVFTPEEMEDATNNFDPSNLVGGHQDQVYKGRLRDGSVVLVKCLKLKQKHSPQALQQKMEVISKLRHRHLVSVLGHCIVTYQDHPNTATTVFVVLENIAKGSLRDLLSDWRKREVLKWPQRMAITMGIARGIQYLHTGGVQGNDLKTENIRLDESLTAKISSYNLALLSKGGTEGPENPKTDDIYRLGVILTEVIIGRPINSQSELDDMKFQFERRLSVTPTELRGLIDPSVRGTFAYESLKTVVQITVNCLSEDSSKRPTVEDVLWHMQYSAQVQEGWAGSGNLSGNIS
ncbi:probable LRR receptor-like serine threonine-kinase At1g14390 [Olea europaea subsp. europaea]|uniref:Probable LRR receptor-like serine threonine-kinase At1g14390 n=1 Tax=Olea europaea subsp. europaea TaxID=158383 RepID=A0A8S0T9J0_OLEEU|nr:probable LRR receptor-like serine threonine-kinase At1g14390 [Olea europaea subsp. europaea]